MSNLPWPAEWVGPNNKHTEWHHPGSNYVLDFHGDPVRARLVVFSDGNHHMALEESLAALRHAHPELEDIFYATTPPNILVKALESDGLRLGNLCLSVKPQIFIGPAQLIKNLQLRGLIVRNSPFMRSRGNVLLTRKGNPKNIQHIDDLLREDVRTFISNPETEQASFDVYAQSITGLAAERGLDSKPFAKLLSGTTGRVMYGERIHHREAPQALADDRADVAMVYYHLALRYVRIFPDQFEFRPLGGTVDDPVPSPANVCTTYAIGELADADNLGSLAMDFFMSSPVTQIYQHHGLERP